MPKLKNRVPSYRLHKKSGQAVVTLSGHDHYLGPYGTQTSRDQYDRVVKEWLGRHRQPIAGTDDELLVFELVGRFWAYATQEYSRDGKPLPEQFKIKTSTKHLLRLYENHPAAEFQPKHLKVVRQSMIDVGWARNYINRQVAVLVRVFKWGVTEGFVPPTVHEALALVEGLRRGKTAARETARVRPVDDATVAATLPYLSPVVCAMIELQRATGMRPGEVCVLRPVDVDRSGDVWEYVPAEHKAAYRDQDRLICIGPRGQAILRPYLLRPADAYCFSPAESVEWHRAERRARRQTPESCGNTIGSNRKHRPKRQPRARYDVAAYRRAIHYACDSAFPAPKNIASDPAQLAAWRRAHHWSPHRLRHSTATRIRKEFDIEAAKAVLGHSATNVTGIYAEIDRRRAIEVARRIG